MGGEERVVERLWDYGHRAPGWPRLHVHGAPQEWPFPAAWPAPGSGGGRLTPHGFTRVLPLEL